MAKDDKEGMLDVIIGFFTEDEKDKDKGKKGRKKKKKKSIAEQINFNKGGLATKGFKPCKNCGSPANCSAVKRCQNRGK